MKNSLHALVLFIFALIGQFCCAMVKNILISNRSSKNYELRCEKEFQDLPRNEQRLIQLMWFFSENRARGEASIEFYDTTDPWHAECKKRRLCSFILYSHIYTHDGKKTYEAKLERKKPNIVVVKSFAEHALVGLQRLKLTITDDLAASDLTIVD
jgi:hypothetical protein